MNGQEKLAIDLALVALIVILVWSRWRGKRNPMAIRLTRNQIQILKELAAAGEHGRTIIAPASSAELAHLISVQYIMRRALNLDIT